MKRSLVLFTAIAFMWLISATAAQARATVKGLYLSTQGDGAVVSLSLRGRISKHKVFTLENPERLVLDISNAEWKTTDNNVVGKSTLIKSVRSGNHEGSSLRIVLELTQPVQVIGNNLTDSTLRLKLIPTGKAKTASTSTPSSLSSGYESGFETPSLSNISGYKNSVFTETARPNPKPIAKPSVPTAPAPRLAPISTRKPVIVIDPGHGGKDPGAIGKSGTYEKKITLQYSLALKKLLENSGRYKVYLTRSNDTYVDLNERVRKARAWKADMFLSIHADSHRNSDTRGLSVYTISEDRALRETNKLHKDADRKEVIRGVNIKGEDDTVQGVLLDLARRANTNTSATLAEILVKEMGNDAKLLDHSHRQKSLAVLTDIDITSVLIELGYLSNRYEEKLLRTSDYQRTLTTGIKRAVDGYFEKYPVQD